jgi:hypothetical protein
MPQSHRRRIPALGLNPAHAPKAMSGKLMIPDGLLEHRGRPGVVPCTTDAEMAIGKGEFRSTGQNDWTSRRYSPDFP